jgi:hypothetical protein
MSAAPLPSPFRAGLGSRLSPRPFFAAQQTMDALATDLTEVFDLIISLPDRLFDGDLDLYCSAAGIDDRRAALIRRLRSAKPVRSGRADLYYDGSSFKLLEFNIGSQFGAADVVEVLRALMAVGPFVEFAEEFDLGYVDAVAEIATMLRRAAATVAGGREPVVAAIEADGWLAVNKELFRSLQDSMARCGVRLLLGELGQLTQKGDRLLLDRTPLDLILRYFGVGQIVDDPAGRATYELICRIHEQGGLVLHTPLESHLFSHKAALALLSEPEHRNAFSETEQRLIDRLLPWTRTLRDVWTEFNGERVDLLEFCQEHQHSLILKPSAGYSGIGVVAGWETGEQEWATLLRRSIGGPFIVQRRVIPAPEAIVHPDTGDLEHVLAAWGVFISEDGYAGGAIRAVPSGGGAIINVGGNPNTSLTGLFTYPEPV